MFTDTPPRLTDQGIAALRAGDQPRAHKLLLRAVQQDPRDERAWLWLAGATSDPAERCHYLQQVLALNPGSAAARGGLAELGVAVPTPPPEQPLPELPPLVAPPVGTSAGKTTTNLRPPEPEPEPAPSAPPIPRGADDPFHIDFIVNELRVARPHSEIVREVSDRLGGTWAEAEELVSYVQRQQPGAVTASRRWLYLMVAGLVGVGLFVLAGLYLFGKAQPSGRPLQVVIDRRLINTMTAMAAGVFTMMGAALDLDWFMANRRAYFVVAIFGRTAARIFYFIIGAAIVVLGAMAMGMR